jgi:excisionase family DNA binding protein
MMGKRLPAHVVDHLGQPRLCAADPVADSVNMHPVQGSCEKMPEDHEVLTADEAAALLRVSTKTLLALARAGTLPGEKVGRAWRFVKGDVLDYVRGSLPEAGAGPND